MLEVELVLRSARIPVLDVDVAHLTATGGTVVVTVVDVLSSAWGQAWPPVHCEYKGDVSKQGLRLEKVVRSPPVVGGGVTYNVAR